MAGERSASAGSAIQAPQTLLLAPATRERLTFFAAHAIFAAAAIVFGFVFYDVLRTPDASQPGGEGVEIAKYLGIGVTFYATLAGTYDFVTRQAAHTERWFRGLSIVLLALSVVLCLFAMALNGHPLWHIYAVMGVLVVFVAWDFIAQWYYKSRSSFWFAEYQKVVAIDLLILITFVLAFSFAFVVSADPQQARTVASGILAVLLFLELFVYLYFSYTQARELKTRSDDPLAVQEGYEVVAAYYDRGNPVMDVEQRHTASRLAQLMLPGGIVVDLGCGTGRYIERLAAAATRVTAVDRAVAMLSACRERAVNYPNVDVLECDVTAISDEIAHGSVDLIVCCLVVDHLPTVMLGKAFREMSRILKVGGRLYVTDVNGYFQMLMKQHARFVDGDGRLQSIRVYPHTIPATLIALEHAGFAVEIGEVCVQRSDIERNQELAELDGFPLITEYLATKTRDVAAVPRHRAPTAAR